MFSERKSVKDQEEKKLLDNFGRRAGPVCKKEHILIVCSYSTYHVFDNTKYGDYSI